MTDEIRQRYAEEMRLHWLDDDNTDASGNTLCVCGQWADGEDESWDGHMADVCAGVRDEELERLRYERRLLGAARLTLDLVAAGDPSRWDQARREAEDIAQRIVDEIGHPVTDEPALGPRYRAEMERLRADLTKAEKLISGVATMDTDAMEDRFRDVEQRAEKAEASNARIKKLAQSLIDLAGPEDGGPASIDLALAGAGRRVLAALDEPEADHD